MFRNPTQIHICLLSYAVPRIRCNNLLHGKVTDRHDELITHCLHLQTNTFISKLNVVTVVIRSCHLFLEVKSLFYSILGNVFDMTASYKFFKEVESRYLLQVLCGIDPRSSEYSLICDLKVNNRSCSLF